MAEALALAERGLYTTTPNPRVGALVVRDGVVVGRGFHERAGGAHAEIAALVDAGARARGATVYVTLEPCSHHGRTPPCTHALAAAGVARVVAAMADPNPLARHGAERLRAAGIAVDLGLMESEARELNIGFVSRLDRGRPWVRLKIAATLDGRTALAGGESQWITGAAAREDGHRWRARACAILTGIGTVKDDDPRLTVRAVATPRQPLKVLVDSKLEALPGAKLFESGRTLVAAAVADREKIARLAERGAEVLVLPNAAGKVDLVALMGELAKRELNEIHVEAGTKLNGSLVAAGVVDELLVYLAPSLVGDSGRGMFNLSAPASLDARTRLSLREVTRVGEDVRIIARLAS
ncbi:MAG: bifunctional diaminohydroxyphosphoribosylaminopyrimidine deaminase/5-amino-6-(5-phosphoribosylamino)uracil reductase RibD [Burkholderiales bacterium]|jgi:diaminohydroxyphosphoribosylaminopyrimidine deaminase/5-amino-6-(5-phosphoribosylamino)uracil reductase|nr:bifunctional diaminohydroxyphosphoribosylaminopyrimidine deaminase/5-amino-6-(5-phosphoribosylamino)uracil reductase RibD [Burkholderiales bacterium]